MTSNWIGQLDWQNMLSLKVITSSHWPPMYRFNDFIVITFCPLLKVWLNTLEMFPPVKEKLMLPEEGWRYVRELNYKWNCSTYFKNVLHFTLYSSQPSSARRVRALPVGLETSTSSSRFRTQIIMPFVFFSPKKILVWFAFLFSGGLSEGEWRASPRQMQRFLNMAAAFRLNKENHWSVLLQENIPPDLKSTSGCGRLNRC